MRFLLFQVKPWPDRVQQYLEIAAGLKPRLAESGGCEFLDRFRSLEDPSWILSFQIWESEASLAKWRRDSSHFAAQATGRREVFEDYRLRVGEVIRDDIARQPTALDPQPGDGALVVIVESTNAASSTASSGACERYESLYRPGELLCLFSVGTFAAALALAQGPYARGAARVRIGRTDREYGLFDRVHAPQQWQ